MRIGEWIAYAEGADAFCRRAASALDGALPEKADRRLAPAPLAAASRVFARDAAVRVALEAARWIGGADAGETSGLTSAFGIDAIVRAQTGAIADMDAVADALYGRAARAV
jgi:alkylation response protein AidB-like acyl-CoA dehydrogenase